MIGVVIGGVDGGDDADVCALSTVVDSTAVSVDRSALPLVLQSGWRSVLQSHCLTVSCSVEWKGALAAVFALSKVVDSATGSVDRSALPSVLQSGWPPVS